VALSVVGRRVFRYDSAMKNPEQWTVDANDVGTRFDLFLNEKLADVSRSQIQKAIKRGEFLLNGEMATVHAFLKEGDVITREAEVKSQKSKVKSYDDDLVA
jgi:23S rRNA-/tRNA-specific pseudouridylate synthase